MSVAPKLAGTADSEISATPASMRRCCSSSNERSSSDTNSGLPPVACKRSRNRWPGAAPVSAAASAWTSSSSSGARRKWRPPTFTTVSSTRSSSTGRGTGRRAPTTASVDDDVRWTAALDHAEREVVGPVEVLRDQHHRRRPREHLECVGTPLDHGVAEVLDVAIVGGSIQEIAQLRSVRCGEPLVGSECVGDITGTASDLVGGHFDHSHPRGPRRVGQRGQQVALADPGFTLDQHGTARGGRQRREQLVHHGELDASTDRREPVGRRRPVDGRPQLPRLGEAPEAHAPPVHEAHDGGRARKLPDDVGHQHLAAVGTISDAGGCVDGSPDRVVVEVDDLAGVDPDPHPRRRLAEGALAGHAERHGLAR